MNHLAGAGGGFDVYAGIPIYERLRSLGKKVFLANLSFVSLATTDAQPLTRGLYAVKPTTTGASPNRTVSASPSRWQNATSQERFRTSSALSDRSRSWPVCCSPVLGQFPRLSQSSPSQRPSLSSRSQKTPRPLLGRLGRLDAPELPREGATDECYS